MIRFLKKLSPAAVGAAILFLLIQAGTELLTPAFMAKIVNRGIVNNDIPFIVVQGGWMLLIVAVNFTAAFFNMMFSEKIAYKLGCDTRREIYQKALQFSDTEYDRLGTSSLITRGTNDVSQIQNLVETGLNALVMAPIYLVGGAVMSFLLNPSLASVSLALLPIIAVITFLVTRFSTPLFSQAQKLLDKLNRVFHEGISGVKVIRAFTKEDYEYTRYQEVNENYTKTSVRANCIMNILMPALTLCMSLAAVFITWIGAKGMDNGTVLIGDIMGIINYSAMMIMGFVRITEVFSAVPRGMISARRINEVLDMPVAVREKQDAVAAVSGAPSVVLKNVSYRYPGAKNDALSDISFSATEGQTIAIIGSTGSGKSTVVRLLERSYDAEEGSVEICGYPIEDLSNKALCRTVSAVEQKTFLFAGTIRDNLLAGNAAATDEELWEALRSADADEFVHSAGGLDAEVQREGGNFSGGQKQRLAIARALVKKADVYVFDDSFSALDYKTDAKIRIGLKNRLKNAVTVIVAQRISTIMNADRIIVLNNGRIAGIGTHEQLRESNETYREILESQHKKEVLA